MDFNELIQKGIDYYHTNPALAITAVVVALFLLFTRPKLLFVLILIAFAAAGMNFILTKLSATGLEHTKVPLFNK